MDEARDELESLQAIFLEHLHVVFDEAEPTVASLHSSMEQKMALSVNKGEMVTLGTVLDRLKPPWQRLVDVADRNRACRFIFEVQLCDEKPPGEHVYLWVLIPVGYPEEREAVCRVYGPGIGDTDACEILHRLHETFQDDEKGRVMVFEYVNWLKEQPELLDPPTSKRAMKMKEKERTTQSEGTKPEDSDSVPHTTALVVPTWSVVHCETLQDRKSVFQGHLLAPLPSMTVYRDAFAQLTENRKINAATHNIAAWRIECERGGGTVVDEGYDDDGEHQAGQRMLFVIQQADVVNCAVIVSRWYGGIHLGPDRFKHIMTQTRKAIDSGRAQGLLPAVGSCADTEAKKGKKGKGKAGKKGKGKR